METRYDVIPARQNTELTADEKAAVDTAVPKKATEAKDDKLAEFEKELGA
jgi:hypothetical protein